MDAPEVLEAVRTSDEDRNDLGIFDDVEDVTPVENGAGETEETAAVVSAEEKRKDEDFAPQMLPESGSEDNEEEEEPKRKRQKRDKKEAKKRGEPKKSVEEEMIKEREREERNTQKVRKMVEKMVMAYNKDVEAILKKTPALAKLAMVDEVVAALRNNELKDIVAESEELWITLAKWLRIMPNGVLPNKTIRDKLLMTLVDMDIDKDLASNGLASVLHKLSKCEEESEENRMRCHRMIEGWIKMTPSALNEEELRREERRRAERIRRESRHEKEKGDDDPYLFTPSAYPQIRVAQYTIAPSSEKLIEKPDYSKFRLDRDS